MIRWSRCARRPDRAAGKIRRHALEPRGAGTPAAESLSSYLVRLAGAQVLPTATFAVRHFGARLESVAYDGARNLYGGRGVWMNGMGRWARGMVARLQDLTGRAGLAGLTALPWQGVLAPSGLTANVRRWCPCCYRDMRALHGECWDPLVWFLAPAAGCARHDRPLATHCWSCGVVQPWLPHDTAIGCCAVCGADLAVTAPAERPGPVGAYDRWVAGACGDLCAAGQWAARNPLAVVAQDEFSRTIRWLVDELDSGNRSAFARRIGVSVHTPSRWIGSGTIRLDSLLRLSARLGLQPVDLLLREREIRMGTQQVDALPRQRRRSAVDWHRVERELDAMLDGTEAVSLRDAARRLGVRVNSLRKRLPAHVAKWRRQAR